MALSKTLCNYTGIRQGSYDKRHRLDIESVSTRRSLMFQKIMNKQLKLYKCFHNVEQI